MLTQLIIGVTSVLYLEAINYIEHYGLERKQLPDGSFENVNIRHSWNAPHRFSNYILFKLQRHSDHHENALKPYQTLCSYDDSPLLPSGYAACLLLAFFPKFWFEIMNPLVEVYRKGDKPSPELLQRCEALMAKFVFGVNLVFLYLVLLTHFTSF
jgi:alkane 1-monooxygenase